MITGRDCGRPGSADQSFGDGRRFGEEQEEGKFVERAVKPGAPSGDLVPVLAGLKPGEKVVTDGSFFLRAEAARTRSGG